MALRDHEPVTIDKFNGLWARGDYENTPIDHFIDCENLKFVGTSSIGSRDGIGVSQDVAIPLLNVKRIYNYPTISGNTTIVLVINNAGQGEIYHVIDSTTVYGPILTIDDMTDFAFLPYAGRGYISPFTSYEPTLSPPISPLLAALTAGTSLGIGVYQYAFTYVTADGETTASPTTNITTTVGNRNVNLSGIVIGGSTVTERKIYRTAVGGTQLKLVTTLANNTATTFADTVADGSLGVDIPTTNTVITSGLSIEKGVQNEFVYVYAGNGTAARKAAGAGLSGTMTIANGAVGHTDPGLHIFGFVSETVSGYLCPPALLTQFTSVALSSVSFGSIPTSGDPNVVKRHLVATKVITSYNGDLNGYTFYFVPDATIDNNTDNFLNSISFFDQDLLDDASHLSDNYTEIAAGAVLTLYRNRLCVFATYDDISVGFISQVGEPEAISQITGLIAFPPDGNPVTNAENLRDILYVTKRSKTGSFTDNGDDPSTWPFIIVDNALGTAVHGIATVIDSGSASVDYLIIATYAGITMFNGRYIIPELSWKIEQYWRDLDRNEFANIQILNAPIQKELYIVLPNRKLLVGNYSNGMDLKKIRWMIQSFSPGINTIAVVNIDEIIIGADIT